MDVPQMHDSVDSRENMSTARLAQMEAAAQFPGAGNEFEQPVHGELLLPLLPGEQAAPRRLGGRPHAVDQESFPGVAPRHPGRLTVSTTRPMIRRMGPLLLAGTGRCSPS